MSVNKPSGRTVEIQKYGCPVFAPRHSRDKHDVGKVVMFEKMPHKFFRAGQYIRGDYVLGGYGLTHIDSNAQGQLIYHVFVQEILPNTPMEKEWIGKCLIYYVVDLETKIVLSWGVDQGGNPLKLSLI